MPVFPSPDLYPSSSLLPDGYHPAAERLFARLRPLHDGGDGDGLLMWVCEALTAGTEPLEEIVREDADRPAWARAVDADLAPLWVLPWLASLVGVQWAGPVTDTLRTKIKNRPRWRAGTPGAIKDAAVATMAPGATHDDVRVIGRVGGSPWRLTVITGTGLTTDPAATELAVLGEKHAGVVLTYIVSDAAYIDEGTLSIDSVSAGIESAQLSDIT